MIETPSLRTRVTLVTGGVLVVLVIALEAFVYLSLRDRLTDALDEVLDTRVAAVQGVAGDGGDPREVVTELTELGIPAVLRTADGQVLRSDPAVRRFDQVPPGPEEGSSVSRTVVLAGDTTAEVFVSRAGVDATLQRILVVESAGSVAAVLLAGALLLRASSVATRPLDRMVDTALQIAAGDRGRRLTPSDPTTELGRMAAAFDRTFDALDEAITEAEAAEHRSRRFLADAAHQLRTPLAGLRASAETLLAHPDGPDRQRLAGNVAREAARLSRLVDRLLRVARIDRGETPVRELLDLAVLAEDEVERQRPLAPSLAFAVRLVDDPPFVRCDPGMVREALANLLDNARRHASSSVTVEVAGALGVAEVRVRDDGPGLDPDAQRTAFDRFSTTSDGSGLGLPIARGIAEAHGGDLRWRDGAFVLTVPVSALDG